MAQKMGKNNTEKRWDIGSVGSTISFDREEEDFSTESHIQQENPLIGIN